MNNSERIPPPVLVCGAPRESSLRRSIVVLLLAGLAACDGEPASHAPEASVPDPSTRAVAAVPDGHARMIATLARVAAQTPDTNEILGDRQARAMRERLAKAPPDAPRPEMISLLMQLGAEELRLGNETVALAHLTAGRRLLDELDRAGRVRQEYLDNASYMLGVAHLRRAETENCCRRHTPESCLLPIRGGGLHTRPEGSRQAMTWLLATLEATPRDTPLHLKARWLLNLAAMTLDEHPDGVPPEYRIEPDVFASGEPFPPFRNLAPALGLDDFDLAGGVVADDLDGDLDVDLLVSTWDPTQPLRLHVNGGDGTFSAAGETANLDGILGGFNLVQADYDNDGDVDVLVLRGAWIGPAGRIPNSLLRNDGHGRFTDVTFESGLGDVHWPTQTAGWADYDNDGDLDVYVGNEVHPALTAPSQLFRNDGDGTFTDVAESAGVLNLALAKSVAWGDYDADGFVDLYVSNLGSPNRLYRNRGDGTFEDVATALGVDGPRMSFPAWFWDFDNDGALDLFVASYEWVDGNLAAVVATRLGLPVDVEGMRLYRGDGAGGFVDVASTYGLTDIAMPMGANHGDLDNDGFPDFYLGTGYPDYEGLMPNVMYRNRGGRGFADVTFAGGFGHLQKGHGVAFADLDNDGDQDVFEQIGGFFPGDRYGNALFANPGFGHRWLAVQLVGVRSNRSAIGARLCAEVVEDGRPRSIYRHVNSGGSFGASPLRQTLGLGRATRLERLVVRWPATGVEQALTGVPLDRLIRVVEGEDGYEALDVTPFTFAAP